MEVEEDLGICAKCMSDIKNRLPIQCCITYHHSLGCLVQSSSVVCLLHLGERRIYLG